MLDPAIAIVLVLCFAMLFAVGAIGKLLDLGRFVEAFGSYELLPPPIRPLAARALPFAELTVAAGLAGAGSRLAAVVAGDALLLVYAGAIAINLRRGRHDLACGCGGPGDRQPIAAWMVWRIAVLGGALALLTLPTGTRSLQPADIITIAGAAMTATLLYMGLNQLLGQVAPRTAALRAPPTRITP